MQIKMILLILILLMKMGLLNLFCHKNNLQDGTLFLQSDHAKFVQINDQIVITPSHL